MEEQALIEGQEIKQQKNKLYNQIYEFLKMKEHKEILEFAYSNGFSIVAFVIFIWQVIKIIYYIFMCGKFSVYGIDLSYIIMKEEKIFFQIIKIIGIGIFIFITNYVEYWLLAVKKNKSKEKKIYYFLIKIFMPLIWLIFVTTIIIFISTLFLDINIFELIIDIKNNPKENITGLIVIFLFAILINIIGFELGFAKLIDQKKRKYLLKIEYIKYIKNEKVNKDILKKHGYIKSKSGNIRVRKKSIRFFMISTVMIVAYMVFVLFCIWFMGVDLAEKQTEYKVIFESTDDVNTKKYILQAGNENYICYPIIFETEDYYILTRLVWAEDTYSMDRNYQKIINKEDIQTFKVENIKDDELVNSTYISK